MMLLINSEFLLMTIRVLSFDFDGCLFNKKYHELCVLNHGDNPKFQPLFHQYLMDANNNLFDQLLLEKVDYTKTKMFIGSARQSARLDSGNIKSNPMTGSCFPAAQLVSNHLGSDFDPLLLADIYEDLPFGTTFNNSFNPRKKPSDTKIPYDETKVSILYAQMHKTALEYPNENIVFEFFDDREDIITALYGFYSQYPELIPSNINLQLNVYNNPFHGLEKPIQGSGIIDSNFRQTVIKMTKIARKDSEHSLSDVAKTLTRDIVMALIANRKKGFAEKEKAPSSAAYILQGLAAATSSPATNSAAQMQKKRKSDDEKTNEPIAKKMYSKTEAATAANTLLKLFNP